MHRPFHWVGRTFQILSIVLVAVIALGEGGSLFSVLFDDAIGRSYWIEFNNFPTQIVYNEKTWWFGPVLRYVVRPEKNADEEDEQDASIVWSMRELKGKQLTQRRDFGDSVGASFTIRP